MKQDHLFIAYLVAFPLVIGGLVASFVSLLRRISTKECPFCYQRISKDAFNKGVPCPDCGECLTESADIVDRAMSCCRECASETDCLELWDGNTYCRDCIVRHAPQLLDLVDSDNLAEAMPYSVRTMTWRMFRFTSLSFVGFAALLFLLATCAGAALGTALGVSGLILLVATPVVLLWTAVGAVALPLLRLKIIAWNGQLIVRSGCQLLVAPLINCTWREGKVSEMTVWQHAFMLPGRAIILELPKDAARNGNRVAVGFTEETAALWRGFLTIAGVPIAPPQRSWWTWSGSSGSAVKNA